MGDEGDERETADCGITGQQISRTEDKQNRLPEEQHIRKITIKRTRKKLRNDTTLKHNTLNGLI